jgi:hypothetical protein
VERAEAATHQHRNIAVSHSLLDAVTLALARLGIGAVPPEPTGCLDSPLSQT